MLARTAPYFAPPSECLACPYPQPCVALPPPHQKGHRINASVIYDCVFRGLLPTGRLQQELQLLEEQVRSAAATLFGPSAGVDISGGINNVRGRWLEYILGLVFWNAASQHPGTAIVRLPDASTMQFHELYEPKSQEYLQQLIDSLAESGTELTMYNPDFVCLTNLPADLNSEFVNSVNMSSSDLVRLLRAYTLIKGKCEPENVRFVITVKTSLRSDRSYQVVHEANIVKALIAHLAGRLWNKSLRTAFYAMIVGPVSEGDRKVFTNPATHTLVQVSWSPEVLVDGAFRIDSVDDVREIADRLLAGVI